MKITLAALLALLEEDCEAVLPVSAHEITFDSIIKIKTEPPFSSKDSDDALVQITDNDELFAEIIKTAGESESRFDLYYDIQLGEIVSVSEPAMKIIEERLLEVT